MTLRLPSMAARLIALCCAVMGLLGLVCVPANAAARSADYVVLIGAAGLRWDDVSPTATPHLWHMAERGSVGTLTVRSGRALTCPGDGWLTLGAGNFAERSTGDFAAECAPMQVQVQDPPGDGGFLTDQQDVTVRNSNRPWGAKPGALAESVRCSTAVGPGAAIALARSLGRVDRYVPTLPSDPAPLFAQCVLSAVDAGTVSGSGEQRAAAVRHVDETVGKVLAARPEKSLVMALGLSDTESPSRLHVAIADGPGFDGGWLISSGTNRPGYIQLVDIAPTALAALGRPRPVSLFVGQPALKAEQNRPAALERAVADLEHADREAGAGHRVGDAFIVLLVTVQLALLTAFVPVLRWLRRTRTAHPIAPPPAWLLLSLEIALIASALALPAALIANLIPWWQSPRPGWVFTGVGLAVVAALTAAVWLSPLGKRPLGPLVLVSAIATVMVGVDVLTGSRLQLNGVAGYSALDGLRYSGLGAASFGVFAAGLILGSVCWAQRLVSRARRPLTVLLLGLAGALLVGAPGLGADPGSAIALMVGVCVASALAEGGWLKFNRLVMVLVAGCAFTAIILVIYMITPGSERGWLVRLLTENDRQFALQRLSQGNVVAFVSSPLTLLAVTSGLYGYVVLLRPWGGLRRIYGLYPAVRGGVYGLAAASLLGGLAVGAGLTAAGAAAATVVPLLLVAGLRALRHVKDISGKDQSFEKVP